MSHGLVSLLIQSFFLDFLRGLGASSEPVLITQTCTCNIQQYFTAVKMFIFR